MFGTKSREDAQITRVGLIQLGCPKNQVDGEEILGALFSSEAGGCELVADETQADVLVVNTCAFIDKAKKESVKAILKAVRQKTHGGVRKVIVTGCMAQRYSKELATEIPEVDAFLGIESAANVANVVFGDLPFERRRPADLTERYPLVPRPRLREAAAPWTAYLKVSEGCDHQCTFCSIPSFRGRHRSKPIERLVAEATELAATGARELILIAQDTTAYGMDLYQELTLPRLLEALANIEGLRWLRLLYCYPTMVTDRLLGAMAALPQVIPYIDMPLQHADDGVLSAMKRGGSRDQYVRLIDKMRSKLPDLALRTTFIVGFPGETDVHFNNLMRFVEEVRFDRVGVFTYSREESTPSYDMPGRAVRKVAAERRETLMGVQQAISRARNEEWIGRELDVLVETPSGDDNVIGRSFRDAPEIDGSVLITGCGAKPGSFARARVNSARHYDLVAEPV